MSTSRAERIYSWLGLWMGKLNCAGNDFWEAQFSLGRLPRSFISFSNEEGNNSPAGKAHICLTVPFCPACAHLCVPWIVCMLCTLSGTCFSLCVQCMCQASSHFSHIYRRPAFCTQLCMCSISSQPRLQEQAFFARPNKIVGENQCIFLVLLSFQSRRKNDSR